MQGSGSWILILRHIADSASVVLSLSGGSLASTLRLEHGEVLKAPRHSRRAWFCIGQAYVSKMVWQIRKQHSRNQVCILLGICKDVAARARGMS